MTTIEKEKYLLNNIPSVYGKNHINYFHDLTVGKNKLRLLYYADWLDENENYTNEYVLLINLLYNLVKGNESQR